MGGDDIERNLVQQQNQNQNNSPSSNDSSDIEIDLDSENIDRDVPMELANLNKDTNGKDKLRCTEG